MSHAIDKALHRIILRKQKADIEVPPAASILTALPGPFFFAGIVHRSASPAPNTRPRLRSPQSGGHTASYIAVAWNGAEPVSYKEETLVRIQVPPQSLFLLAIVVCPFALETLKVSLLHHRSLPSSKAIYHGIVYQINRWCSVVVSISSFSSSPLRSPRSRPSRVAERPLFITSRSASKDEDLQG